MKTVWFKRAGGIYRPISAPGAMITLAALAFCVQMLLVIDRKSHSARDTLYGVFPLFACVFVLHDGIAGQTGDK